MPYEKREFSYLKRLEAADFNYIDAQLIDQQTRSNTLRDTNVAGLENSLPSRIQSVGVESGNGHVQLNYGNTKMGGAYIPTMETYLPPSAISAPQSISALRGVKQQLEFSITPANTSLKPRFVPADKSILRIDKDGVMTPLKIGRTSVVVKCGSLTKTIPVLVSAFIRPKELLPGLSVGMHWDHGNQYMFWDTVEDTAQNRFLEVAWTGNCNSFFAFPRHGGESYEFQIPPHCTATFHLDQTGLDMENGSVERYYKFWYYHVLKARDTEPYENWYNVNKSYLVTDVPASGRLAVVQSQTSLSYFVVHSDVVTGYEPGESGVIMNDEPDRLRDLVIHNTSNVTWYPCIAVTVQYSTVTHEQWIQAMRRLTCTIVPD